VGGERAEGATSKPEGATSSNNEDKKEKPSLLEQTTSKISTGNY